MGHMEEVVEDEDYAIVYYFPHHGVYRQESKTTPSRVVFNASSITTSGESLNSLQLNGGVIKRDLFSILLNFRARKFAHQECTITCDKIIETACIDDGDKYPLAAEAITSDVYMDDLTGADDLESGRKLQV
ncbi:uncharacterized protein TNCV_1043091 [Trichonephila clavipes]|nr:uncharacterized protein TNCV_1043091 [Trichonephila clavipes]